jgi:excinuclease UvrABC ATPase subunit
VTKKRYIVLALLIKKASNETKQALEDLKKSGPRRIILDLQIIQED